MELKHRPVLIPPNIKIADGEGTKAVLTQMNKQLNDMFKNIYDDLLNITPERVSTLPTASAQNLGRFFLLINAGADDTLHICVYRNGTSDYAFKEVTLT